MPAPASLQLCCSLAELQRSPCAAIDVLQQFQSEGADDDWIRIASASDQQLVHTLAQHLNDCIAAATVPHSAAQPADCLAPLLVSDLALYSALAHLLFIFASLSSHSVCPVLLQYDLVNIPLVVSSAAELSDAAVAPLILLRLQLLALTISAYPASIPPPPPHPLILDQTLSLLAHASDDIRLAASACLFLLLSISSLAQSMPALLCHPGLPAFLAAMQRLLSADPSSGLSSPFLPLSLTVLSEMAACLSLLQQRGEPLPLSQATLLEVWDSVCELLEEGSGAGDSGQQREGMDADVRSSALDCLFALLSIPSMQHDVMLQQYSAYKRQYRDAVEQQAGDEQQQRDPEPPTVTTAERAGPRSDKRQSLNPFDDDDASCPTEAPTASAQSASTSSSLEAGIPFTAADCDAILDTSTSAPGLSAAALTNKIDQLSALLDGPATQHDWLSYLDCSQYRLLLVLAYLYTQGSLPPASCDAILSILLSLSSLSATSQGVTSAVLSHPSLLAVLLSQLAGVKQGWSALVRLQALYFVYSSQSSPALDANHSRSSSAASESAAVVHPLIPLLSSDDEATVALAVYVTLLSHQSGTAIPSELLSLTSSYAFQLELLQLINRGALHAATPPSSAQPSSAPPSASSANERSDVPQLLRAALLFLGDLLSSEAGVGWVYTNDLYVLVDVLLQRIEDQQAVSEAEAAVEQAAGSGELDVVVLCERVLLALLDHWQGWQANGGYKRRQMLHLMQQVEREHGADGDSVGVQKVYSWRTALAAQLLSRLSSIAVLSG